MAVDLTVQQGNLAKQLVTLAEQIDVLYNDMEAIYQRSVQVGAIPDEVLVQNTSTQHLASSDIETFKTRLNDMVGWLDAAGEYRRDIILKVRVS